jgi:ABC-type transporter Mla subunit MlaD
VRAASRTDLAVGLFLLGATGAVLAALIATSGWGVDRYELYIRTDDATDVATDTKIYLRGFEVGRVARVEPRPAGGGRGVEFLIRASVLARFPDGTELRLPRGTGAEVVTGLLGNVTLQLVTRDTVPGYLEAGDTLAMQRRAAAMEAFGSLATDLKGIILEALEATTLTLRSVRVLTDSLAAATGTARRFMAGIQPETEKAFQESAIALQRLQRLLDSTNQRSGVTLAHVNQTLVHTQRLLASADTLTRLFVSLGAESRPEVLQIIRNTRHLTEQLQYVMEQLGRRPMRFVTGVTIPDSLTVEGRARRTEGSGSPAGDAPRDSAPDSVRTERSP